MSNQTFSQKLSEFKTRHGLTLPKLAELVHSKPRALDNWLSPTKPVEPRFLTQQAVLAILEAYDRKRRPKVAKPEQAAETPAVG